jgi:hypothetical protein
MSGGRTENREFIEKPLTEVHPNWRYGTSSALAAEIRMKTNKNCSQYRIDFVSFNKNQKSACLSNRTEQDLLLAQRS